MTTELFETAPGFDQPLAMLKHCHGRLRKQLAILQNLLQHLPASGADIEAQQAAHAVLRYFNEAAVLHHADEEDDLLPLLNTAAGGDDALTLQQLSPQLLHEHRQMDGMWNILARQLGEIATGHSAWLAPDAVAEFTLRYSAHMALEETVIAPMAARILTAQQMRELGDAMRARRATPHP